LAKVSSVDSSNEWESSERAEMRCRWGGSGTGERCKLLSEVRGGVPTANAFWSIQSLKMRQEAEL